MKEHTIKIEGLPDGWEALKFSRPRKGEFYLADLAGTPTPAEYDFGELRMIVRRKVRKYDWSKTLDDVLVILHGMDGFHTHACNFVPSEIAPIWQPNIHGKCPVDPEASIVRVRLADGREREWDADVVNWSLSQKHPGELVTAWQFIRLADGWEF